MALRTPAIVSDIPSALEVVGTPPAATVVPLDDRPALAGAIIRLLGDEHLRSALAEAGYRQFVENFSIDQVARNMMLVYARAARARGRTVIGERFEQAGSVTG
jgi:glycosyltransferase involved in cell wall biosynthesis